VQADQLAYMSLSFEVLRSRNCTTLKEVQFLVFSEFEYCGYLFVDVFSCML